MEARAVKAVRAAKKPPRRRAAAELTDSKLHFLISETLFTVETRGEFVPASEVMRYWYGKFKEDRVRPSITWGLRKGRNGWTPPGLSFIGSRSFFRRGF